MASEITFDWKPGNEIDFRLEADGKLWDAYLIKDRLAGPAAISLWQGWGYASDPTENYQVELIVVDCPGPPRGWLFPNRDIK